MISKETKMKPGDFVFLDGKKRQVIGIWYNGDPLLIESKESIIQLSEYYLNITSGYMCNNNVDIKTRVQQVNRGYLYIKKICDICYA